MALLVDSRPSRWGDWRANLKHIIELARSKSRYDSDVLVFPVAAITGTVHRFEAISDQLKLDIEEAVQRLARSIAKTPVRVIVPAYTTYGLGIFSIHRGACEVLPFIEIEGGLVVLGTASGLDYDLVFRTADVSEPFESWSGSNYVVVDSQTYNDTRVWAGQCRVVKRGRLIANYLAEGRLFDVRDQHVTLLDEASVTLEALKVALTSYMARYRMKTVSLGLSGGLDSAVVAAIAVAALGPQNVKAYVLPSRFTSEASWSDAKQLAANLGLQLQAIDIEPVVGVANGAVEPVLPADRSTALMKENLQARARGLLLMSASNVDGSLVLTTSNKSEAAVGYCTLYGDMVGGLALLADIYKSELYTLCRTNAYLSRMIPASILDKAPSAELREDQKDEDSLPPYPVLDRILKDLVEHRFDQKKLKKRHGAEVAEKVFNLVRGAHFKRQQAAPCVRLTSRTLQEMTETEFFY